MSEQDKFWFVARTCKGQEFAVRSSLEKIGVECFIPTQMVVHQLKHYRRRVEIPVIRNLIFIYTTKEMVGSAAGDYNIPLFYMNNAKDQSLLVVPEKQMKDFKSLINAIPECVTINEDSSNVGTIVQMVQGKLNGIEGELIPTTDQSYVIIRMAGLFSASIKVPENYLKIVND